VDLSHALWIGGPPCSGKSSVAAALADRFGLQLYHVDARTWVHEARMPRTEFGLLTMDERWVDATPDRMLGWFVTTSRHRFRLVLEDLRELPEAPGAVVEGPQLFPTSVAAVLRDPAHALFLLPDPDDVAERRRRRGPMRGASDGARATENVIARDLLIAAEVEREARDLRLATLRADVPLDELVERAAAHFERVAERLPHGGDLAAVRRFEEEVRQTQIRLYEEWLSAATGTSR
jgi:cytidylate kinase